MTYLDQPTARSFAGGPGEFTGNRTVCGICSGTCGMTLTLENGELSAVEGDSDHPVSRGHICPKARALPEIFRAPDRLRHPVRKAGSGTWEEISWDEAFAVLSEELGRIKRRHGPEALAVHVGHAGVGKEFLPYAERFCALYGTPNFSTCGSHCYESKSMANMVTFGKMPTGDYARSKCIVLWGKNPGSSAPSLVNEIAEARRRGCALIVIDPRRTPLAEKADFHLQLRPGTDGALALGFLHVIVAEQLYDKDFVERWTVGFDVLCQAVHAYPPEKVERITRVPAGQVREAARLYASAPAACISLGVAVELSTNGFQAARGVAVLQAITFRLQVLELTYDDLRDMPEGYAYHYWTERKYEKEGFNTDSGKVEIYSGLLEHHGYDPVPTYAEPAESPLSTPDVASLFPLVLTTGARRLEYLHSRFRNVGSLRTRVPEPYVEIHPSTADGLGVNDGDMVSVETPRGGIAIRARCTPSILPGVISMSHGWDEANANILTDDACLDPTSGFPGGRCLLARIARE